MPPKKKEDANRLTGGKIIIKKIGQRSLRAASKKTAKKPAKPGNRKRGFRPKEVADLSKSNLPTVVLGDARWEMREYFGNKWSLWQSSGYQVGRSLRKTTLIVS